MEPMCTFRERPRARVPVPPHKNPPRKGEYYRYIYAWCFNWIRYVDGGKEQKKAITLQEWTGIVLFFLKYPCFSAQKQKKNIISESILFSLYHPHKENKMFSLMMQEKHEAYAAREGDGGWDKGGYKLRTPNPSHDDIKKKTKDPLRMPSRQGICTNHLFSVLDQHIKMLTVLWFKFFFLLFFYIKN